MGPMQKWFGQNWLTSLGGLIALAGGLVAVLPKSVAIDGQWGVFLMALGGALVGFAAKQYNVHSTNEEVKTATVEKKADDKK